MAENLNTYPISGNPETGETNPYINGAGFKMADLFTDLITKGSIIQDTSKQGETSYNASLGVSVPIGKSGFSAELQGVAFAGSWSQEGASGTYSGMSSSYGASYSNFNKKGSGFSANVNMSPQNVNVGFKGQYRY